MLLGIAPAMSKPLETVLLGAAGLGLFGLCYVGFAAIGGVPMHTLPVVGSFFPAPPPVEDPVAEMVAQEGERPDADLLYPDRPSPRQAKEIIGASLGVIGSFAVHAPFEREELERLVAELEARETTLVERLRAIEEREAQVEEHLLALQERSTDLDNLRAAIESDYAAIAAEREVLAAERAAFERSQASAGEGEQERLKRKAELFVDGEPDVAAQRLVPLGAEEAGKILRLLPPDRARQILDTLSGDDWTKFVDAYTNSR
jgi:flagellar motility protein MotE (MotC chaperone)